MKNTKKTIKAIIFLTILILNILIIFPSKVNGDGVGTDASIPAGPTPPAPSEPGGEGGDGFLSCSATGSTCTPQYKVGTPGMKVIWDIYNKQNEQITNKLEIKENIIAGTAIGGRLAEKRMIYWAAYGLEIIDLWCTLAIPIYGNECDDDGDNCWDVIIGYEYEYFPAQTTGWSPECQAKAEIEAKEFAVKTLDSMGKTYDVEIPNPNDARCFDLEKNRSKMTEAEIENCSEIIMADIIAGEEKVDWTNKKVEKNYYYEKYGACVNAHTSKVTYVNKDEFYNYAKAILSKQTYEERLKKVLYITKEEYEKAYESGKLICPNKDDYYIVNDTENEDTRHWHIFTPLNTKSTDGYTINLIGTSNLKLSGATGNVDDNNKNTINICTEWLKKYKKNYEYMDYIVPGEGEFTRNYSRDLSLVEKTGCRLKIEFSAPIIQKFYGEEVNGDDSILKGFNFYYRPIDINNPFPNGINEDSYWKTWSDTKSKEPNIKESFKQATYWTNALDSNLIREYNQDKSYLDWETMNIDGTSQFITSYLNRNSIISKDSVYNLGCAPTNMCKYYIKDGEKVENPLYQPECKNAKIGVSCP